LSMHQPQLASDKNHGDRGRDRDHDEALAKRKRACRRRCLLLNHEPSRSEQLQLRNARGVTARARRVHLAPVARVPYNMWKGPGFF